MNTLFLASYHDVSHISFLIRSLVSQSCKSRIATQRFDRLGYLEQAYTGSMDLPAILPPT